MESDRVYQEYRQAVDNATPAEIAEANQEVREHLSEYGHSFDEAIIRIVSHEANQT